MVNENNTENKMETAATLIAKLTDAHLSVLEEIFCYSASDWGMTLSEAHNLRSGRDGEQLFCDLGRWGLISTWTNGPEWDWTKVHVFPSERARDLFVLVDKNGCFGMIEPRDALDSHIEELAQLPLFLEEPTKEVVK